MHKYTCYGVNGEYLGLVSCKNKAEAWRQARTQWGSRVAEIIKTTYSY